ncbi:hypothetical protein STEG23_036468 [Scotinomys teguina]
MYSSSSPPDPHSFEPGDSVLIQRHQCKSLEPRWKGPYLIILTTLTALKVDGISIWIHHSHARPMVPVAEESLEEAWRVSKHTTDPLKLKLHRGPGDKACSANLLPPRPPACSLGGDKAPDQPPCTLETWTLTNPETG